MDGPSGSSSGGGMMNFVDQNSHNAFGSMMMMMPLMSTSHQQQHHHQGDACSSFLPPPPPPPPPPPNYTNNNTSNSISYFLDETNNNINEGSNGNSSCELKAKIMGHPHYHRLLVAYVNCRKVIIMLDVILFRTRERRLRSEAFWQVGAPPEVVARLEQACASAATMSGTSCIGQDPGLDQFMEAYCEMLTKYEHELSKPFRDAMLFLQRIECQFKALSISSSSDAGDFLLTITPYFIYYFLFSICPIFVLYFIIIFYYFCALSLWLGHS